MRKLMYVVFGLMIFAGAAGLLFSRQMREADTAPASAGPAQREGVATRGLKPSGGDRIAVQRGTRRIDRGINQYRSPDGSWQMFEAAIDVLNVIVGIVGIGLALSGMRDRREARRQG
jgi:hypothetical protein